MSDRKATFAKRQRESELKEKAKIKEERRLSRRSQPRDSKGPEIAWDEAVNITTNPIDTGGPSLNPTDDSPTSDSSPPSSTPTTPTTPTSNPPAPTSPTTPRRP